MPRIKQFNEKEVLEKAAQKKGELDQQKAPRALALSLFIIFSGLRVISKAIWNKEELNSVIEPVLTMLD